MRTVNITEIRQDATRLIDEAARTHEPIMVIQRSRAAAYVLSAGDYEAIQQELRALRHQVFWQEVEDARAEHDRGETTVYDDVEDLIADLGLEKPVRKRAAAQVGAPRRAAVRKQSGPQRPARAAAAVV